MTLVGRGDGSVELRRIVDGKVVGELRGHQEAIMSVTLSPDGALVAVGSEDGFVTLWRLRDRALLRRLEVKAWWVEGVAFSPSGELLATVGVQRERAVVKLWRVVDGELLWEQDGGADVGDVVVFTPDGASVIAGFWDGSVRQWNAADGGLLREIRRAPTLRESVESVVLSPDGARAAVIFNMAKMELWSTEDWTRIHAYEDVIGHPESAAFSPDGQLLATGSGVDNVVQLWQADRGGKPLATFKGHTWEVANVAFTPDQRQLISAAHDGTVRIWALPDSNE
jgi:WD40 repeat protein